MECIPLRAIVHEVIDKWADTPFIFILEWGVELVRNVLTQCDACIKGAEVEERINSLIFCSIIVADETER